MYGETILKTWNALSREINEEGFQLGRTSKAAMKNGLKIGISL